MNPTELGERLQKLHTESFGWALSCCGWDDQEAEDVLQTAYLKVVSGRAHFEGRSSFRTWLFGVIRRTGLEFRRRRNVDRKRVVSLSAAREPAHPEPDPERLVARRETAGRLRRALEKLSERQREVLHLVFYQEMTIAEAADVMEVSLGSARTHYERGKGRLREMLKEGGPSE